MIRPFFRTRTAMPRLALAPCALIASLALSACDGGETRYTTPPLEPPERVAMRYDSLEIVSVSLPSYAATEEIYGTDEEGGIVPIGPLWADDPARAVTLQLSRDLGRIGGAVVAPEPWPFRDFPDARVDVRMEEFLATGDGRFRISGQYFVAPEDEDGRNRAVRFDIAVPLGVGDGPAVIAAARSAAVRQLAVQIAENGLS